jgi:hypothetical protein
MAGCTVDKTEEGVEVKPAEVEVEWDTTTVRTPDIDVIPRDSMRDTVRDTLPSR